MQAEPVSGDLDARDFSARNVEYPGEAQYDALADARWIDIRETAGVGTGATEVETTTIARRKQLVNRDTIECDQIGEARSLRADFIDA